MVNYETIKCHACSKSLDVGTAIYMRFDKPYCKPNSGKPQTITTLERLIYWQKHTWKLYRC